VKRIAIVCMLAALFIVSCDYVDLVKETETETFTAANDFEILYIDSTAGVIDINMSAAGNSGGEISVTAEKVAWGYSRTDALQALEEITVTLQRDGNTYKIIVETPFDNGENDFDMGYVNLTLNNVDGKEIIIKTVAGAVACDEARGADITTVAGSIELKTVSETLTVRSTAGKITVEEFTGESFDLGATAGDIEINVAGEGKVDGIIETTAGAVSLDLDGSLSCSVDLETDVGDITVSGVQGVSSSSGLHEHISFDLNEAEGTIRVETTVGSINARVYE